MFLRLRALLMSGCIPACVCRTPQVAAYLMGNPGAIVQLNMGEGKTRVILPMLALHWGDGSRVVSCRWDRCLGFKRLQSDTTAAPTGLQPPTAQLTPTLTPACTDYRSGSICFPHCWMRQVQQSVAVGLVWLVRQCWPQRTRGLKVLI